LVLFDFSYPIHALLLSSPLFSAVIRRDVELSSPEIGLAPFGSIVKVVGRAFSEHPVDKCIERLKLAGNGGWISVRLNRLPPHDDLVVELVDVDGEFDPSQPGLYHLNAQRAVFAEQQRQQQQQPQNGPNRPSGLHNNFNGSNFHVTGDLSSVDEEDDDLSLVNDVDDDDDHDMGRFISGKMKSSSSNSGGKAKSSTSRMNQNQNRNTGVETLKCVVCLSSERNATIVHGETGHVVCCLVCSRILKARGDKCPVCRLNIDVVIQHFYA
jgi:hypothetical protein